MGSLLSAFTFFHVILSVVGIGAGFVVLYGMLTSRRYNRWNALFLWTTVATSVTGYFFPFHKLMPSHILGALSLIVLAIAIRARYSHRLQGGWRRTYVITAALALYFNVFVLVVQLFDKVPELKALAPTQSEPPFAVTQLTVLLLFVALTVLAAIRFRNEPEQSLTAAAR